MVDRPAIERKFLVVKRQEDSMGAFEPENNDAVVDELIEKMDWHDIDVDKALPPDLASAIKAVVAWMKKAAGTEGAPKDEINRVAAFLGKVGAGKYPYPKPAGKGDDDQDAAGKGDGDGDASKQAKCPKCGAEMKAGVCPECGFKAGQDDADKGVKKGVTISVTPEGKVEISGEGIAKGGKQFTADRIAGVGTIAKQALALLAETDPELAKSIISELAKATLPADIKWTSGTSALDASVKKDLVELVKEAVDPIAKKVDDTAKKVEDIAKARPAPQSDGGGDNTDKTDVNKGDKKFWSGVPIATK